MGNVEMMTMTLVWFILPISVLVSLGLYYTGIKNTLKHSLLLATTTHKRHLPVSAAHAFTYSIFYFLLDLDDMQRHSCIAYNTWGLFSLWTRDYFVQDLMKKTDSLDLKTQVLHYMNKERNIQGIQRILLLTTPRVFGYSFNPLKLLYCFDQENQLNWILLQVNNTFHERHIYLCSTKENVLTTVKRGYDASFSVKRAFHVSPFNNRSGDYLVSLTNPLKNGIVDVHLSIKDYHDTLDTLDTLEEVRDVGIRLTARVWGKLSPLRFESLLYLLLWFPFSSFLTFPRILYQAGLLAYKNKLKVYQRPNPIPQNTVLFKYMDSFQVLCARTVLKYIYAVCIEKNVSLRIIFPTHQWVHQLQSSCLESLAMEIEFHGKEIILNPFPTPRFSTTTSVELQVNSPNIFTRLFLESNIGYALCVGYVRLDLDFDFDFIQFLSCPTSPSEPPLVKQGHLEWKTSTPFPLLDSLQFKKIHWPKNRNLQIMMGIWTNHMERIWFESTTDFALNPFQIHLRLLNYLQEFNPNNGDGFDACDLKNVLNSRGDIGNMNLEKSRFLNFLKFIL